MSFEQKVKMSDIKDAQFATGVALMEQFCARNNIVVPAVIRLKTTDKLYHLATCAFYRKEVGITIMVEKCANLGYGGRAWSWPGYTVDRTPYGVIQHELGHYVDDVVSSSPLKTKEDMFSYRVYQASTEDPLTGYLGTDQSTQTFFKEWFAENFRLFVTNPCLCEKLRPKFYRALTQSEVDFTMQPVVNDGSWLDTLRKHGAPIRIINQAEKKIMNVLGITQADLADI